MSGRCKACDYVLAERDFLLDPVGELCRQCFSYVYDEETDTEEKKSRTGLKVTKHTNNHIKDPDRDEEEL